MHPNISVTVVVIHPDDHDLCHQALGALYDQLTIVDGGTTRQESTFNGLCALKDTAPDFVHIHDGARPFVTAEQINQLNDAISYNMGAILGVKITDTIKRVGEDNIINKTIDRDKLYLAQTPQSFPFHAILEAHEAAALEKNINFTDDSSIAEWFHIPMRIIDSTTNNLKITWPEDIARAERQIKE